MKRATKILIALGATLSLGLSAAAADAQSFGFGMGGGGHMGGYGPGYSMGPGMMGGYGHGYRMTDSYRPGYGMGPQAMFNTYSDNEDEDLATLTPEQRAITDQRSAGFGPGWNQGHRGGPRGYSR